MGDAPVVKRRDWPIRRFRLGEEPGDDLSGESTPAARLAMMWSLARDAWQVAGREIPDYARTESPGRLVRPVRPR